MNCLNRFLLVLFVCPLCSLLVSCATIAPGLQQEGWMQFATAADAQSTTSGEVSLHFVWEIPQKRALMLARLDEERAVLYQVDHKAGLKPDDATKRVSCYFKSDQLYCVGLGETAPSFVASSGDNLWPMVEAHAAEQIRKIDTYGQQSIQSKLNAYAPAPYLDLTRQRHPFEWGGEYETVENAQAFLEAVTANGTPFRSAWPRAPWLGSQGNSWENQNDRVKLATTKRCSMLATSDSRTAAHYNHDFWAADTVKFQTVYRWQQPVDWQSLKGVRFEEDGVFMHGSYTGRFEGQGLTYVSGWSPSIMTVNASRFDPSKYSVAEWNLSLVLPNQAGLRERVFYAVTFLNLVCGKG